MLFSVKTREKPKVSKDRRNGKLFLRIRGTGRALFLPSTECSLFNRQGHRDFKNISLALLYNVNGVKIKSHIAKL